MVIAANQRVYGNTLTHLDFIAIRSTHTKLLGSYANPHIFAH